jgi:hypothetical protein
MFVIFQGICLSFYGVHKTIYTQFLKTKQRRKNIYNPILIIDRFKYLQYINRVLFRTFKSLFINASNNLYIEKIKYNLLYWNLWYKYILWMKLEDQSFFPYTRYLF